MEFLKYSNINLSEIIEEGLGHTLSKIVTLTSTKDIEAAFKKFQYKDQLLIKIRKLESKHKDENFTSDIIAIRKPKSIKFNDYTIRPMLDNKKEIEKILVFSLINNPNVTKSNTDNEYFSQYVAWSKSDIPSNIKKKNGLPPVKINDPELCKEVHNIFFGDNFEHHMKIKAFGKTYDLMLWLERYDLFDAYTQGNHLIYDEIREDIGRELTDKEFGNILDKVLQELYQLALKFAKRAENSKAGKTIGAKYAIKQDGWTIDIEYNFDNRWGY